MVSRMAAVLKHWREASTLMLVTGRLNGSSVKPNFVSGSSAVQSVKGANLEVLLLKRSDKSKFMPNLYVFPGGVASDVDFSADWLPVFDLLGKDHRQNVFDFSQRGGQGAPMFSRLRDDKFSHIPSEVAFRICAIRETFEESGVLIARSLAKGEQYSPSLWDGPSFASYYQNNNASMHEWRHRVIKDPDEFLRMCQELRLVPDVWSLYEWADWLTPLGSGFKRRFDTAFFVCCVDGKPDVAEDEGETVHSQWGSPYDIMQQYQDASVSMAPPQLYEIRRLMEFSSVPDLLKFSWHRGQHRVDQWLPVRVNCADGIISVLPGDSLYPEDVNPEGPDAPYTRTETLEQLALTHPHMNRLTILPNLRRADGGMSAHVTCNIVMPGGHVAPQSTSQDGLGEEPLDTAKL